jgi:adenosylcobyric acid synthase
VRDPLSVEAGGECAGLALLHGSTELSAGKSTRAVTAHAHRLPFATDACDLPLSGYEIHHGRTTTGDDDGWVTVDGQVIGSASGNVWGTYLHGIFTNDEFRTIWLKSLGSDAGDLRWDEHIDRELDRLADALCAGVDLDRVRAMVWPG